MKAALLESHCIVKMDDRKTNLDKNLASGRPVLMSDQPEQNKPLLIVGSGPSVSDQKTIDYIQAWPGDVWAINGAYDFLLDQGLICEGFFGLDPLPGLADYVRRPQEETTFYIASMCDPSVLETLKDNKLLLWHACAEDSGFFPEGHKAVIGGTTAVTRAPFLALALGYRDINLIGVDSSYDDEKGQYCYQWGRYATDINEMIVPVKINGEGPFYTELGLLKQVTQLGSMLKMFNQKKEMLKIHPAGLMGAFMRAPELDDSSVEVVPFDTIFKTGKQDAA
jgi:hypothetical protein